MPLTTYDVIITGGGLAGLCLARQLRQEHPDITVLVAEKKKHPVPEAAHKVGESSVEIGAHYFSKVLGIEEHLVERQLYKLGLRYFFTEGDNRDVTSRIELGPKAFPKVPSFQFDRGRLENFLLEENRKDGVDVLDGCKVTAVEFGDPHHRVDIDIDGTVHSFKGRWVVDGTGRTGLLRRKLGLSRPASHNANAVWFRMSRRLKIDDWSPKASWQSWMPTQERWMSTVHLMGTGYWTWLIPLASESHSIGIVADDAIHPYQTLNRFDRAMAWLHKFEPQCAEVLEAHRGDLDDFLGLQHFSHSCAQMYSADRWALIGEAGVFTDPFYSPGSDFISIGNDIVSELITRDRRGEDIAPARGVLQPDVPAAVQRVPEALRRAVPDHGQRAGDDGEGGVGQRLLLGDLGAAVLPPQVPRHGVHAPARRAAHPLLLPARAHAAQVEAVARRRPGQLRLPADVAARHAVPAPHPGPALGRHGRRDADDAAAPRTSRSWSGTRT